MEIIAAILTYLALFACVALTAIIFATVVSNLLLKVPFVPSSKRVIQHIAKLANIKKDDQVYDLGSGDGRFLFEADKYTNKELIGFEQAMLPYCLTKIKNFFHKANIRIHMKNFMKADLASADLIYCYLGPETMTELGEKIQKECRKGTRIYSNTFSIKNMEPMEVWPKDKKKRLPTIYYYQV